MNLHRSEFILESREHLAAFETSLLAIEKSSSLSESRRLIESGLRAVHSMKGDSGFLGFTNIRNLTHAMESALEPFRDGSNLPSSSLIEVLLKARDRLASLIEDLEHSQTSSIDDILLDLRQSSEANSLAKPHANSKQTLIPINLSLEAWQKANGESLVRLFQRLESIGTVICPGLSIDSTFDLTCPIDSFPASDIEYRAIIETDLSEKEVVGRLGKALVAPVSSDQSQKPISINLSEYSRNASGSLVNLLRSIYDQVPPKEPRLQFGASDLSKALPSEPVVWKAHIPVDASLSYSEGKQQTVDSPEPPTNSASPVETKSNEPVLATEAPPIPNVMLQANSERLRSLRINVELLDRLMNLISELTLIRNQAQVSFEKEEGESRIIIQRLNSVTSELQDTVLQTRMQPVGNLFGRFPRMVRDLARQLGKEVEVAMIGQEVELDKTVLERLSDPLTHLIRNSIDHGIETPAIREAKGKPRIGKIVLSATPADGQVTIEIRDDGRGIDPSAVRAKALAMRLRTESELERMNHRELFSLILLPGFSTAKEVTDVSGRGVGMDVVRTNVEELEGTLAIDSNFGVGTSMLLRVPLTLAIVPCLIVTVGEDRFAVPQRELEEIVCLHPGGKHRLEQAFDTEVFRLREALIPVIRLTEVLCRSRPFAAADKSDILAKYASDGSVNSKIEYILVLRSNGKRFGLLVDNVQGREEIVVKPMHAALKRLAVFSGATMMGDGRVALIANVEGIVEHARCFAVDVEESKNSVIRDPHEVHRVLLFEYGPQEQYALPLVQVKRVELLDMSRVERVGDKEFVTIDGKPTRILKLSDAMQVSECDEKPSMFLILPKFVPEPMGILANRIIDTESLAIHLQSTGDGVGVLGTAIVRNKLSLFLDIQGLRETLFGSRTVLSDENEENNSATIRNQIQGKKILLVDDTPFFREVVKRYLSDLGIEITTANDGLQGMAALENHSFDLVVSDIEMPNMNGWEFCKAAREKGYRVPFVALTSLAKDENEAYARSCGFDDFEEKLDHDRLLKKVCQWLRKPNDRRACR